MGNFRCFIFSFVSILSSGYLFADQKFNTAVSIPAPQTQTNDNSQSGNNKPLPDCTRPNADPRCNPPRPPYNNSLPYYQGRPRPVIINQLPAEPAIDVHSLNDDWEGCRKAKLGAIRSRNSGKADEANNLDEWLWKNCRSYSNELRDLEQSEM